jgi:PEP-CTERM motif-containing protein
VMTGWTIGNFVSWIGPTNATSSSTWTLENLPFTAAGTVTTISLLGEAGVNYIGLDNVRVQCVSQGGCGSSTGVPEPATLGLMSLGLGALGLGRRRRLRAATN